ncbi:MULTISPECIES: DUF6270 domain-containing protein [Bacillus]|uniref:DUF6270 domain-containing protein n=1 Tax=Bacillus TaxID=1386 RepID=UPI000BF4B1EA|nr:MULTISPECIES: DUF6270 domain-containing protein [Bacillus]AYC50708.1 hypothetical protein C7M53_05485 [Bacillus licheniformis]MDE1427347.1 DUF6270 domain-containing protein [Bacillus licheniformis]MEC4200641.1 DUF6270 domain-containing protein [Bacillus sp. AAVF1]MED4323988.1 DUF6270 domain-containing protein [Bacillus licheniformis]MED4547255.1 DUF6270 domain-containing protein [Bacillus licheniformis]
MKKKIAVFGSCISRDNFNTQFNPNYKMFFDLVVGQHQTSFISITSKPIPFQEDDSIKELNDFNKYVFRSECTKEFLNKLVENKPDYLLIDCFSDVYNGVMEISDEVFITNSPKFQNLHLFKQTKNRLRIDISPNDYYLLWASRVNQFFKFMKDNLPDCKIILIKARFSDKLQDGKSLNEERKQSKIRTIDVELLNSYWDVFDYYIRDNFNVKIIDMTEKEYLLSTNHPWGRYYCHYTVDFNHDIFNKLQKIIIEDTEKELTDLKNIHTKLQISHQKSLKLTKTLKKKINFFENESFQHAVKRHLLKYEYIRKLNDLMKGRKLSKDI